jgi:myo-inositol-1(or 4)-monophosphatase
VTGDPGSWGTGSPERQTAIQAALAAGRLVREGFARGFTVFQKGEVDLVTEVDLASEKLVRETVLRAFPGDLFYGEEGGGRDFRKGRAWVVDPLDGTTNFAHRLPLFAVSVAFLEDGVPKAGAVYQPISDDLFVAERGGGAFGNGKPLHVGSATELIKALGVTGFPYKIHDCLDPILGYLREFMPACRGMRRTGSAALDLCYVASGVFDFFYELKLNPWDVAAGGLLVQEAGGVVTDFSGGENFLTSGELVAANSQLHPTVLGVLAKVPRN